MDYLTSHKKFTANLIEAYKDGKLSADFQPYFEWKTGGEPFSREQAYAMLNITTDLLGSMFDDPEPDEELRIYLEAIDGEIVSIIILFSHDTQLFPNS